MLLFIFSQVMFEKYGFQGVYIAIQAVLTLYAQGITICLIFNIPDTCKSIILLCLTGYW